jgi:serpin B
MPRRASSTSTGPPRSVLLLLNAVYFKGDWRARFDRGATAPGPFHLTPSTTVQVPMMQLLRSRTPIGVGFAEGGVEVGELPYGGGAFVMTIVLPPRNRTLAQLVAGMDAAAWQRWIASIQYVGATAQLPKFELAYERTLNDALRAMGIRRAFTPGGADLTRMSPAGRDLFLSEVVQKTYVRVDEEGTEAAAATRGETTVTAAPPGLVVDRPFLVAIRERLSGAVLFLGAIGDPR